MKNQNNENIENIYDEEFYHGMAEESYISAKETLHAISMLIPSVTDSIDSVIDVGCGVGTWLKAYKEVCGNIHIFGIDGNNVNPKEFFIDHNLYKKVDLTQDSQTILTQILEQANLSHVSDTMGGGGQTL